MVSGEIKRASAIFSSLERPVCENTARGAHTSKTLRVFEFRGGPLGGPLGLKKKWLGTLFSYCSGPEENGGRNFVVFGAPALPSRPPAIAPPADPTASLRAGMAVSAHGLAAEAATCPIPDQCLTSALSVPYQCLTSALLSALPSALPSCLCCFARAIFRI